MTPQEERQILELHTKWGNRWSKIARKLPGRTDNEIKNYWRTFMRKKSQEKKRALSPSPSMSNSSAYSSITSNPAVDSTLMTETKERSFYDTGGLEMVSMKYGISNNYKKKTTATSENSTIDRQDGYNSMDEIWKDITLLDDNDDGVTSVFGIYNAIAPSSIWDYPLNTLSMIDSQEEMGSNMFLAI